MPEHVLKTKTGPEKQLESFQTPSGARIHVLLKFVSLVLDFKITEIESFAGNMGTTNRTHLSLPAGSQKQHAGKCPKGLA